MRDGDVTRLARALKVLGETFNEPVSDTRAEAYFFALDDFTIEHVEEACRLAIRHARFFPRPAELRELIVGTDANASGQAWLALVREVRRTGYTGTPELEATARVAMERVWGSWITLCQTLPAEGPGFAVWEKRFRETYQTLTARERRLSGPPSVRQLVE